MVDRRSRSSGIDRSVFFFATSVTIAVRLTNKAIHPSRRSGVFKWTNHTGDWGDFWGHTLDDFCLPANQSFVIPTPLAIVLAICQGPLRLLPLHSQASFPRSVALPQLPSPRACSLEVVIWYTDLLEIPIPHRGLEPHKPMPMTGVPKPCTEVAGRPRTILETTLAATR